VFYHKDLSSEQVRSLIRQKKINFAGHKKLKIAGNLSCWSGKKMHSLNRVFFSSWEEVISSGYRPCGHCMKKAYQEWKSTNH
jgi:methylphosphotriester-DNA--protein-cysteine methyltransferase